MKFFNNMNREVILSYFLGFVVLWFGANEIMSPAKWTVFVPEFMKALVGAQMLVDLVILHGILLVVCGLALVFNYYRRLAASIVCLMLLDIIITLFLGEGLDEIVARDIGLLGMAFALALKN